MIFGGSNPLILAGLLLLAMALGAILALIAVELRKKTQRRPSQQRPAPATTASDNKEQHRRQELVARLMELYSGVHSGDALSDFLNKELERRHEDWRVRIPPDGPGEIYNLDPANQKYG